MSKGLVMSEQGLKRFYIGYIVLTAIVGGIVGGTTAAGLVDRELALKLFLAFFSFTMIIGLPLAWIWWSKVDEAVKEAHKWAWFWGGSIGMTLGIFLATANIFTDGRLVAGVLAAGGFEAYAFEAGLIGVVSLTAYGYMAAWAFWWWKHR